jgi:serine-type D-Ala-D-Ala carboxypeptidase (penicillin-binding protein 5/6)
MKKICFFLFIIIPFKVMALGASSYVVMDADSGRVLAGKDINTSKLIASTTKIMTSIIALENGHLDDMVTIDDDVKKAYGSAIYLEVGEQISLKDLLYGLMLRSGNDAAIEIANHVAGSMVDFVNLMNDKAKNLGMTNTHFVNDNGLEEKTGANYSSSYDMGLLMRYALKNEQFKDIIHTKKYNVKTNYKAYLWENKNRLLKEYKYTIGGKTGFTEKARRTLVTAATKNNKTLIIVTLNDPDDFNDHQNLYETYFKTYNLVKVLNKNSFKLSSDLYPVATYIKDDFKILLTKEEEKKLKVTYDITDSTIAADNVIGKAIVRIGDTEVGNVPIYKGKDLNKENLLVKFWNLIIFWR